MKELSTKTLPFDYFFSDDLFKMKYRNGVKK